MQARHLDRKRYFEESAITSANFYLPYIRKSHAITKDCHILEIGCGEGGNLKPFTKLGCHVVGIDISRIRIEQAQLFFAAKGLKGVFKWADFLGIPFPDEEKDKYDIIILHDVIEHIPDKFALISHIRKFMKTDGVLFVAFPAWYMPFGGHQQICHHKIWSKIPFFHLLPTPLYHLILRKFAKESESIINELLYIKRCRCPIRLFEQIIKKANLSIANRQLWFINPHYQQKFGLRPIKLHYNISQIPFLRDFCSTSCFYLLKK
ncbi:class I SAM-dependent methyltransferase [Bacteroides pyogenes]|uniref:class I SAM-dependent methyltransferase n=1 Tax=Bacteroides pyogenes TaxID=310300 RepID=UPI002FD899CD